MAKTMKIPNQNDPLMMNGRKSYHQTTSQTSMARVQDDSFPPGNAGSKHFP